MDQEPLEISIDGNDPTYNQFPRWSLRRMQARIPARAILYMLSFSGFLVSFVMRNDINLAIIAMVRHPPRNNTGNDSDIELYCYNPDTTPTNSSATDEPNNEEGEYDWDSTIQSSIISSFYWCYVLSQILGGYLTQKLGPKKVFGYSQLVTALGSVCIPFAADLHFAAVVFLRYFNCHVNAFEKLISLHYIIYNW
jgi:MFS family permease